MTRYEILKYKYVFSLSDEELRTYYIKLLKLKNAGHYYNEVDFNYCQLFFNEREHGIIKMNLEIESLEKKLKDSPSGFSVGSPEWEKRHGYATRLNYLRKRIKGSMHYFW